MEFGNPGRRVRRRHAGVMPEHEYQTLTVTELDDYTPTERGGSVLTRLFIMVFSMLIG